MGRGGVLSDPEELLVYECDGLPQHKFLPRAVVFPNSTQEASEVVRALVKANVSYAPRGAGTGLSGGALARDRGVVIELARMRRLLVLDAENRLAVVETGFVNAHLSRAAAPLGLYYAPDPSSQATCTIGGNIAENAGGIHCLKYGVTVDHVLAARVVMPDGQIVDLGGEQCVGYDLLGLFIGSEGTFGIATEATLRLTPIPPAVRTLLADFTDVDQASRAVSAIIAAGLTPAALEMVDGATIRAVEASVFAAGMPLDAEAALLIELDGLAAGLDEEAAQAEALCRTWGARNVRRAADEYERKKLWAARKNAFGAMGRIAPDIMLQDAVVPRSRLPEVLAATYRAAAQLNLTVANVFHAGDGNLHPFICFDSRDPDQVKRVKEAGRVMMEKCVQVGGTITGEHGVGLDKSEYLPMIFSEDDLEVMLRVRSAFDPSGLCNPGKVIPVLKSCGEARGAAKRRAMCSPPPQRKRPPERSFSPETAIVESRPVAYSGVHTELEHARLILTSLLPESHIAMAADDASPLTVIVSSIDEAREVLRAARAERWGVGIEGAGGWQRFDASHQVSVILKTTALARVVEHEPADLVATAQAGTTLAAFNRELGRAQQWLP
ncbi:MAG: FAD-linked oxidase C-terminal domain-containing protein [Pyrinomonadaceae bacterium]